MFVLGQELLEKDLINLGKAVNKPSRIDEALAWALTPQGGDFWMEYYDGGVNCEHYEEAQNILVETLKSIGRQDLLPVNFQVPITEDDIKEMV